MNRSNGDESDLLLRKEALQAFRQAVAKVIAEHKRLGMPLSIWRGGEVVRISPEEAEAEYAANASNAFWRLTATAHFFDLSGFSGQYTSNSL